MRKVLLTGFIAFLLAISSLGCGNINNSADCCEETGNAQSDCCETTSPIGVYENNIPDCCGN